MGSRYRGQAPGSLLLAHALRDCWEAGKTLPFIAVILDCINESVKAFYRRWEFAELRGHPFRLFWSAKHLDAIIESQCRRAAYPAEFRGEGLRTQRGSFDLAPDSYRSACDGG